MLTKNPLDLRFEKELDEYEKQLDASIERSLSWARENILSEIGKPFIKAFAWLGGGVLLSWFSYEGAKEQASLVGEGTYFIFWGAIIYGIVLMAIVLWNLGVMIVNYENEKKFLYAGKKRDIAIWKLKKTTDLLEQLEEISNKLDTDRS